MFLLIIKEILYLRSQKKKRKYFTSWTGKGFETNPNAFSSMLLLWLYDLSNNDFD